jgi:outer membrane protein assembly factor BamB
MIDLDAHPADLGRESRPPGVPRLLVILAVALLTVASLGASAAPAPGLTLVLSAGGTAAAAFTLGAETLYTAQYGVSNPTSESAVRAWNLADGSVRWATALPQGVQNLVVREDVGVLMARSGTDPRVSVLDARTGEVLWGSESANTSVVTVARSGLLFTTDVPGATEVRLADPRTGRTVWTRTVDARVYFGPDDLWSGEPTRIVAIGISGRLVTLDFTTGAVLARSELGGPMRPDGLTSPDGVLASTVGDNRLLINRRFQGRTELTAYSLTPFARLWQRADAPVGSTSDCAEVWCLVWLREGLGRDGDPGGVTALDPAGGNDRWTNQELTYAGEFGGRGLIAFGRGESPEILQVDPATGRRIRTFGQAFRIGADVLVHPDTATPTRAAVIVLDPADGAPHLAGTVDVVAPFGCEADDRYLACPTMAGPTKVWRLPLR